jgi:hypothetical protein
VIVTPVKVPKLGSNSGRLNAVEKLPPVVGTDAVYSNNAALPVRAPKPSAAITPLNKPTAVFLPTRISPPAKNEETGRFRSVQNSVK